jgi:hypothetical protein
MQVRTRQCVIVGIALLATPAVVNAHDATGIQMAQVSVSPGPGPVTPDGSPPVNRDPYQNLQGYTPPPNLNFPPPPRPCSGDIDRVSQDVQTAYYAFTQAQMTGQPPDIVLQEYTKYMQIRAFWECLQANNPNPSGGR